MDSNKHNKSNYSKSNNTDKTIIISSPITGIAFELSATPDEAFADGMMGDGVMVVPEDDIVYAPEDGEVSFVFETKHALGFETDSGMNLLIHVGIDTVTLNGRGFEALVVNGQRVKKGEPMIRLDLKYINKYASSIATPILCTELDGSWQIRLLSSGHVKAGEQLFAVDLYN